MASRHTKSVLFYLGSFARRNGFGKRMEAFLVDTPVARSMSEQARGSSTAASASFLASLSTFASSRVWSSGLNTDA
jgi:hypothetical protein